jgi:hypothetical protein
MRGAERGAVYVLTLADWVGAAAATLTPLVEVIRGQCSPLSTICRLKPRLLQQGDQPTVIQGANPGGRPFPLARAIVERFMAGEPPFRSRVQCLSHRRPLQAVRPGRLSRLGTAGPKPAP